MTNSKIFFQKGTVAPVQKLPLVNQILNPRQLAEKDYWEEEGKKNRFQSCEMAISFGLSTPTGDLLPLRIFFPSFEGR